MNKELANQVIRLKSDLTFFTRKNDINTAVDVIKIDQMLGAAAMRTTIIVIVAYFSHFCIGIVLGGIAVKKIAFVNHLSPPFT
jgi:hypothetical protein